MSSAVETLASQYNGAKEYKAVGIVLWKCIIILGKLSLLIVSLDFDKLIGNANYAEGKMGLCYIR